MRPGNDSNPLVFCFDGSADSRQAIEQVGGWFEGAHALVVTAWQRTPGLGSPGLDHTAAQEASATAAEGVELASAVGLTAEPVAVEAMGPPWQSISDLADHHHAALIVVGSRGLTGLRSALLGSVSSAVVHHAHHPTLVVHSNREATVPPKLAASTLTA
jgi:nucleotide-binding universal stress UspA family protein